MRRRVLALDRTVLLLLALLLICLGAAAVTWGAGWATSLWPQAPDQLDPTPGTGLFAAPWWGWATLAAGLGLGALALWWLIAHRTHHSTGLLQLTGSDQTGRLRLDGSAAADLAAERLSRTRGVRNGKGKVTTDRGQLLAELDLTLEPDADLPTIVTATDHTMADLARVLGRDDVYARVTLHVARAAQQRTRVQ